METTKEVAYNAGSFICGLAIGFSFECLSAILDLQNMENWDE